MGVLSDLRMTVDIYISLETWNELKIPMSEIGIADGELDSATKELIKVFLSKLSL